VTDGRASGCCTCFSFDEATTAVVTAELKIRNELEAPLTETERDDQSAVRNERPVQGERDPQWLAFSTGETLVSPAPDTRSASSHNTPKRRREKIRRPKAHRPRDLGDWGLPGRQ
jgi:hypothetical protein